MGTPSMRAVSALDASLGSPRIGQADLRYDRARRGWKGRIDRRPLAIAQCADVADVVNCVRFAREHQLSLAIRGCHTVAGKAMCDDGLVVDLSHMQGICRARIAGRDLGRNGWPAMRSRRASR